MDKDTIIIADDSMESRNELINIFSKNYDIIEAADGNECINAIQSNLNNISAIILDMVMPNQSGIDVLMHMSLNNLNKKIPVIMISEEMDSWIVDKAYDLGVTDYILKPFNAKTSLKRVENAINLFKNHKMLVNAVSDKVNTETKNSQIVISILSELISFRGQDSGQHTERLKKILWVLLNEGKYLFDNNLSAEEIDTICEASVLHDVGKLTIPERIINKPGRYTPEEFQIMKTHPLEGAKLLDQLKEYKDEKLIKYARDIAMYHHERYDGAGYPYAIREDEIPMAAQFAGLAIVYEALTSKRSYHDAYSSNTAIKMILDGECGKFNPKLIELISVVKDKIEEALDMDADSTSRITNEIINQNYQSKSFKLFEMENEKFEFLAYNYKGLIIEYNENTDTMYFYGSLSKALNLEELYVHPFENEYIKKIFIDKEFIISQKEITIFGINYKMNSKRHLNDQGGNGFIADITEI